jgi:hypothetical protein
MLCGSAPNPARGAPLDTFHLLRRFCLSAFYNAPFERAPQRPFGGYPIPETAAAKRFGYIIATLREPLAPSA